MRVRIESVAEHWAQCPGKRRTANCLAASRLVSPAVRSEPLLTLASPLFETARGRFWCREALAAGTPRLQTPQFLFRERLRCPCDGHTRSSERRSFDGREGRCLSGRPWWPRELRNISAAEASFEGTSVVLRLGRLRV